MRPPLLFSIVPYEEWLEHCRCTKLRGDNEVASSAKLREAMQVHPAGVTLP